MIHRFNFNKHGFASPVSQSRLDQTNEHTAIVEAVKELMARGECPKDPKTPLGNLQKTGTQLSMF